MVKRQKTKLEQISKNKYLVNRTDKVRVDKLENLSEHESPIKLKGKKSECSYINMPN